MTIREEAGSIGRDAIDAMLEQRKMEEDLGDIRHSKFTSRNIEQNGVNMNALLPRATLLTHISVISQSSLSKRFFQIVTPNDDTLDGNSNGSASITRRVFDVRRPSLEPLHTCIAVHEALGRKAKFRSYYKVTYPLEMTA